MPRRPTAAALIAATCVAFGPALAADPVAVLEAEPPVEDVVVEVVAEGLTKPWSAAFLPDGSMLVTERPGRLRVIGPDGVLREAPVAGAPPVFNENQAGLFDIVPHPDFETNRRVFLTYAHGDKRANALRVASAVFDGAALSNLKFLYEAAPLKAGGAHYGGRLVFLPDGTFVVTTGEGYRYREKAQTLDNAFGKIVRLNDDGSVPADNPFVGRDGARPEIYSYGHRNPQGLVWDAARGALVEHEHGPRGGDEINIIEAGANYGWPIATYGVDYSGAEISPFDTYDGTVQPVLYWNPSIAPSGLAVYDGPHEAWRGDYFVGALAFQELRRVVMDGARPVGQRSLLKDRGERVRDVRQGPDGALYVLTTADKSADGAGRVLRVTPKTP